LITVLVGEITGLVTVDVPVVPDALHAAGGEGQSGCGGTVLPVQDAGYLGVG